MNPVLFLLISGLTIVVAATHATKGCSSIEIRKEWRALSKAQRKSWIDAVNCLGKLPRSGKLKPPVNTSETGQPFDIIAPVTQNSTYYDDLVYAHMNLNPLIHLTGLFLPWHRLYVHQWTNTLRTQCGYKGVAPYWAWEKDVADFEHTAIWDIDSKSGLGGFGDPQDDFTVKTGALDLTLAYPIVHKLRREYRPYPGFRGIANISANSTFTQQEVNTLLNTQDGNFTAFQSYMEGFLGMHTAVHAIVGGDLAGLCPKGSANTSLCPVSGAPTFSANEPIFHLHHGNIDRLWWLWQEKGPKNKQAFRGGSVQNISAIVEFPNGQPPWLHKTNVIPAAGMYESYTIGEVMDTRKWPLCYEYK
ncbi:tyrosinase [Ceratobasidium sp. AG-Ba]|nr:tyrosinase [Ceratobasidium sp. AG-Ba]